MKRHRLLGVVIVTLAAGLVALAQPADDKVYLLHVSEGQTPPDTGLDGKTIPVIVDDYEPLGGKALKVAFAAGDSIGARLGRDTDWKPFSHLRFDAVNPGRQPIKLELNLIHAGTKNYDTRVVVPLTLTPGRNKIRLDLASLKNVNGSAPDLGRLARWYLADVGSKGPTVYLGDIWLKRIEEVAEGVDAGRPPLVGYRIQGKVGNLPVDLTVTPFHVGGAPAGTAQNKVHGDPARLARIRAAKMPKFDQPILFNTPEADAICSALEVFPADNPWNLVVAAWPVHPNSKNLIASMGADRPLRYNPDMSFVLVPPGQKKVDVKITAYPGESDKGPFPVPDNTPIEGWPANTRLTLEEIQRKVENGDRHALVVDPVNRKLYEFYQMRKTDAGWQASQSSVFDLASNKLRPDGWTSADAAGLPIFPAVVRHDELKRGLVEHALRVTMRRTRRAYVYPATHYASRLTDENLPRMGERIRLRQDFNIKPFSPEMQAILKGLKKYGMLVADNGIDWAISVAPDPRIPSLHEELRKLKGSDFEVVTPPKSYRPAR